MAKTSETVTVIRPLKLIALICGCLSLILLIIAIATTSWLTAEDYKQGLWQECNPDVNSNLVCTTNPSKGWIIACAVLCILALLTDTCGVVANAIGLFSKDAKTKRNMYLIAMCLLFFAITCLIIGLIVFPAMFMEEDVNTREYKELWYFGWSYGVGWGSAIFMFGAAILLLVDRDNDNLYYREKTYYNGPENES